MTQNGLDIGTDLRGCEAADWRARLDEIGEEHGHFEPLGRDHMSVFLDLGPRLLVTFENAETIRTTLPDAAPRGFAFARRHGWSHLAIISEGDSWFRDRAIYGCFDRLVDDGFFEDFDDVLFYGAHACGYAACAYSVAAPGARVLAIRPQATLDTTLAGWDTRYPQTRRMDFASRYGFAPDMIEATDRAYIVYNPMQRLDAVHASLFARRNNAEMLRCTGLGWQLDSAFDALDIHEDMMVAAMSGDLDAALFGQLLQARKTHTPYLRGLFNRARHTGHDRLAANLCAAILRHGDNGFFARQAAKLESEGITPTWPDRAPAAE